MNIETAKKEEIERMLHLLILQKQRVKSLSAVVDDSFYIPSEHDEVTHIKPIVSSISWPIAIDPVMIVSNENEKIIRAKNILSVFLNGASVAKMKILDFGCGQGHLVQEANRAGALAVGFDIHPQWEKNDESFTTSFDDVIQKGPYNVIFLYDVLDHCEDPINLLQMARTVLGDGGSIFTRCHPWCSRHGGHLYETVNKAFAHFFIPEEICKRLTPHYPIQKVIHPFSTYGNWFDAAGLKEVSDEPIQDEPEAYFQTMAERIKPHWRSSHSPEYANGSTFPQMPMSISFIDYQLVKR